MNYMNNRSIYADRLTRVFMEVHFGRRRFLQTSASAAIIGSSAGCLGGEDEEDDALEIEHGFVDEEFDYGGWFDDVENFEGTYDMREVWEGTIFVLDGQDGPRFHPPAIAVSGRATGVTITFEWWETEQEHNVVHEDGDFESDFHSEPGEHFDVSFHQGHLGEIFRFYCENHRDEGMKGAIALPNGTPRY